MNNFIGLLRYFSCLIVITISSYSFSQTTNKAIKIDSTEYTNYLDSTDSISFNYPGSWHRTTMGNQYLFTAQEEANNNTGFKKNLLFGKIEIPADLDFLLKNSVQSVKYANDSIVIVEQEIKTNLNSVQYAIFKYTSVVKNMKIFMTNIYFRKNKYAFYLILGNDANDEDKYSKIYKDMTESIKFLN